MPQIKSLIKFSIRLFFLGLLLTVIGVTLLWLIIAPSLPPAEALRDVELQVPLRIYSADQQLITSIGEQRRIPLTIDQIPTRLKEAFLAAEDGNFYQHPGFDWTGTMRGVLGYVRYLGQRRVPGGSTITQQVARRFFLSSEFSVTRKIREIFLAIRIERELSKDEILELYLNKEFLGHRAYGVGAAAQIYYNKQVDQLTLAEMAMLAGLPQRPSVVNPVTNPAAALERRAYVLSRMLDEGFIDPSEYREASASLDHASLYGPMSELSAPWIAEIARQQAVDRFGADRAYTHGYSIVTTVDATLQQAARSAVRDGLDAYDKRHGWRGPERRLDLQLLEDRAAVRAELRSIPVVGDLLPAVVQTADAERAQLVLADGDEVELTLDRIGWAREHLGRDALGSRPLNVAEVLPAGAVVRVRPGDDGWRLAQVPEAQSALVSLEAETGAVIALVGGLDFGMSQFNRATQSQRQPGSAFKPFVYAAALDHGYTPASLVNDAPIVLDDPNQERSWKPQNFSERFFGPTRLREGMIHSRNLISVRIVMNLGLERVIDYVTHFGFRREAIPDGPSMALGAGAATPAELAAAYAVFANGGLAIEPRYIYAILDNQGQELQLEAWPIACSECIRIERAATAAALPEASPTAPRSLELTIADDPSIMTGAGDTDDPASTDELDGPPIPLLARRVISPQTAWLIRSMMGDVIRQGTGRRALALERGDLGGKTGTSNDQRDTWFAGFSGKLVTVVWVGMDSNDSLGRLEQGGRTALPIWIDYMSTALNDRPQQSDPVPIGIVEASIDAATGLRVRPGTPGSLREWFPADRLPALQDDAAPGDAGDADPYDIF